jgi:DNA-binding CsgD family transcriptional regulator
VDLLARIRTLTIRESEVLDLILKGLSNDQVALALFRSPKTVDKHCQRIYRKLGMNKRVNLIRCCMESGYQSERSSTLTERASTAPAPPLVDHDEYALVEHLLSKGRSWDCITELNRLISADSGPRFFGNVVCAISKVFGVRCAGLSECKPDDTLSTVIAYSVDGVLMPTMDEYTLAGTPCLETLRDGHYFLPEHACERFPIDRWFVESSITSYAGIRLEDRILGVLGLIWIADIKPLPIDGMHMDILSMLAPTVAAELAVQVVLDQFDDH